jgi:uncharacterized membrane protein YqjE
LVGDFFLAGSAYKVGLRSAPIRSITVDVEAEKSTGKLYSLLLLGGLAALVGLGLIGLPVATAILFAFAGAIVGLLGWAAWEIAAGHRQAVARRRRRRATAPPVPAPARLRSPA